MGPIFYGKFKIFSFVLSVQSLLCFTHVANFIKSKFKRRKENSYYWQLRENKVGLVLNLIIYLTKMLYKFWAFLFLTSPSDSAERELFFSRSNIQILRRNDNIHMVRISDVIMNPRYKILVTVVHVKMKFLDVPFFPFVLSWNNIYMFLHMKLVFDE